MLTPGLSGHSPRSNVLINYLCEIIDALEVIFFKMTLNFAESLDTMETVIIYDVKHFSQRFF